MAEMQGSIVLGNPMRIRSSLTHDIYSSENMNQAQLNDVPTSCPADPERTPSSQEYQCVRCSLEQQRSVVHNIMDPDCCRINALPDEAGQSTNNFDAPAEDVGEVQNGQTLLVPGRNPQVNPLAGVPECRKCYAFDNDIDVCLYISNIPGNTIPEVQNWANTTFKEYFGFSKELMVPAIKGDVVITFASPYFVKIALAFLDDNNMNLKIPLNVHVAMISITNFIEEADFNPANYFALFI